MCIYCTLKLEAKTRQENKKRKAKVHPFWKQISAIAKREEEKLTCEDIDVCICICICIYIYIYTCKSWEDEKK